LTDLGDIRPGAFTALELTPWLTTHPSDDICVAVNAIKTNAKRDHRWRNACADSALFWQRDVMKPKCLGESRKASAFPFIQLPNYVNSNGASVAVV
jgi:hypothetical protein